MEYKDRQCHAHARFAFAAAVNIVRYRHLAETADIAERPFWDTQASEAERYIANRANRLIELRS